MTKMNTAFIQELIEAIGKKQDKHSAWVTGGLLALYLMYLSVQDGEGKQGSKRQTDEELIAELQETINS